MGWHDTGGMVAAPGGIEPPRSTIGAVLHPDPPKGRDAKKLC